MKFLAIFEQKGDGCDYTIGCGTRVIEFEASNIAEALHQVGRLDDAAPDYSLGYFGAEEGGESEMKRVRVVAAEDCRQLDLIAIYAERRCRAQHAQRDAQDEADRREYERLKQKYGG